MAQMRNVPLREWLEIYGRKAELARKLGISQAAVGQWKLPPPHHAVDLERITGISRYDLRPDIFGTKNGSGR